MDYFSYLRLKGKEDIKDNFIQYLIDYADYDLESAKNYADFMFNNSEVEND